MTDEKRYLPLFDKNDEWALARPDLYVLARMSVPEDIGDESAEQLYKIMAEVSDNTKKNLSDLEASLERKYISRNTTERRYGAMVLMELVRLSLNHEAPSMLNALKLVSYALRQEKPQTQEESLKEQAKTGFRKWRSTCHLEAAFRLKIAGNETFEANPEKFNNFLAVAKALENFMDDTCAKGRLKWNPWRVPEQIKPVFSGEVRQLSTTERSLLASTS